MGQMEYNVWYPAPLITALVAGRGMALWLTYEMKCDIRHFCCYAVPHYHVWGSHRNKSGGAPYTQLIPLPNWSSVSMRKCENENRVLGQNNLSSKKCDFLSIDMCNGAEVLKLCGTIPNPYAVRDRSGVVHYHHLW